tara:strand:+ start:83 stop:283 length:201 start_codon:yes stop_codon:yes gene_type:complete
MSFKPQFEFTGGEKQTNGQAFATKAEALSSAEDRFMRWTMPKGFDAIESDEPVTYRWDATMGDVRL